MIADEYELTETDRAMLAFERDHPIWKYQGAKESEIRDRFDLSPTSYYQRVNRLLDTPAAELAEPATVRRLRALRDRNYHAAARHRVRPL